MDCLSLACTRHFTIRHQGHQNDWRKKCRKREHKVEIKRKPKFLTDYLNILLVSTQQPRKGNLTRLKVQEYLNLATSQKSVPQMVKNNSKLRCLTFKHNQLITQPSNIKKQGKTRKSQEKKQLLIKLGAKIWQLTWQINDGWYWDYQQAFWVK